MPEKQQKFMSQRGMELFMSYSLSIPDEKEERDEQGSSVTGSSEFSIEKQLSRLQ